MGRSDKVCILCIFKIQILYLYLNTFLTQYFVFVFKYIFPHSILYFYFKYILMYLCPSLAENCRLRNTVRLGNTGRSWQIAGWIFAEKRVQ